MTQNVLIKLSNGVSMCLESSISLSLQCNSSDSLRDDGWDIKQHLFKYIELSRDFILLDSSRIDYDESVIHITVLLKELVVGKDKIYEKISTKIKDVKNIRLGKHNCVIIDSNQYRYQHINDSLSIWLYELPSKWFLLSSDGLIDSNHEFRMALQSKYGAIDTMTCITSPKKELSKDTCIKFVNLSSVKMLLDDFYSQHSDGDNDNSSSNNHFNNQSIVIRRDGVTVVYTIFAEIDHTNYLSETNIRQRNTLVQKIIKIKSELEEDIKQSKSTIMKVMEDMIKKQSTESIHQEFHNENIQNQWNRVQEIVTELNTEIGHCERYIETYDMKLDEIKLLSYQKRIQSNSKKIYGMWKQLHHDIDLYVNEKESELRQLQNSLRLETLEDLTNLSKQLLHKSQTLISSIKKTLETNNGWEVLSEFLSVSQLENLINTLNKILLQRKEGSQRYVEILQKANNMISEKIDIIQKRYKAIEALELFKSFIDRVTHEISQYSSTHESNDVGDVDKSNNTKDSLESTIIDAIQRYSNYGTSYITHVIDKLSTQVDAKIKEEDGDDDNNIVVSDIINDSDMFSMAEIIDNSIKFSKQIKELSELEKETFQQTNSMDINLPINSKLKRRYDQFMEECISPHKQRKDDIKRMLHNFGIHLHYPVPSDEIRIDLMGIEKMKSVMDTCGNIFLREAKRYVGDMLHIQQDIQFDVTKREQREREQREQEKKEKQNSHTIQSMIHSTKSKIRPEENKVQLSSMCDNSNTKEQEKLSGSINRFMAFQNSSGNNHNNQDEILYRPSWLLDNFIEDTIHDDHDNDDHHLSSQNEKMERPYYSKRLRSSLVIPNLSKRTYVTDESTSHSHFKVTIQNILSQNVSKPNIIDKIDILSSENKNDRSVYDEMEMDHHHHHQNHQNNKELQLRENLRNKRKISNV